MYWRVMVDDALEFGYWFDVESTKAILGCFLKPRAHTMTDILVVLCVKDAPTSGAYHMPYLSAPGNIIIRALSTVKAAGCGNVLFYSDLTVTQLMYFTHIIHFPRSFLCSPRVQFHLA